MTKSTRETILLALQAKLEQHLPSAAVLERNTMLPSRVPDGGLMILRDGDPGNPETLLSPLLYLYEHRAEVELIVDDEPGVRDAVFDALARGLGDALTSDRTLGGLCDWIEPEAPAPLALVIEGGEGLKAASIGVVLHYATSSPL